MFCCFPWNFQLCFLWASVLGWSLMSKDNETHEWRMEIDHSCPHLCVGRECSMHMPVQGHRCVHACLSYNQLQVSFFSGTILLYISAILSYWFRNGHTIQRWQACESVSVTPVFNYQHALLCLVCFPNGTGDQIQSLMHLTEISLLALHTVVCCPLSTQSAMNSLTWQYMGVQQS